MFGRAVNLNTMLPVEVLTAILVDHIVDNPKFAAVPYGYLAKTALSISQACQLWRNISLSPGGKRLWTHAPLRHKAMCVDAFMARSHPLPVLLKIEAIMRDEGEKPTFSLWSALETALQHSARVDTMILSFNIEDYTFSDELTNQFYSKYEDIIELLDQHSFPALEYLSWATWTNEAGGDEISESVFKMEVPNSLRRLFLSNTTFTPPNPVLCAPLTSLVLEHSGSWPGIDDFLATLLNMPSLDTLVVSSEGLHRTFHSSARSSQPYRSISLPCLTRLVLHDTLSNVPLLFAYIRAPVMCRLDLNLALDDGASSDTERYWEHWDIMESSLRAHYESASFDRLVVSGAGDDDDRFLICASSPTLPTLNLEFYAHDLEFSRKDMRLMRTLRNLLTLPFLSRASTVIVQAIRVLSPSLYDPIDSYDGRPVSNPFSAARKVVASSVAIDGFLNALILHPDRPLLPALRSIRLSQVFFCRSDSLIVEPMFTALLGAVVARERMPVGSVQALKTIEFRRCGITQTAIDALANAVNAEVNWDGQCVSSDALKTMNYDHFNFKMIGSPHTTEDDGILWPVINEARCPY
ncbi:hypothetical protein PENSPDRAFT_682918 [Peniophora sp. CONT]|nr:hypothetical protein PENSPDRAFT_682918 [Peniophora sp. CONT]